MPSIFNSPGGALLQAAALVRSEVPAPARTILYDYPCQGIALMLCAPRELPKSGLSIFFVLTK